MGCKCHDIAKSVGSQTNKKSSKHGSMIPEFCKNIYQKIYHKDFRIGILGNKKVKENWVETDASAQSPFDKYFFGNISQKLHIADVGL